MRLASAYYLRWEITLLFCRVKPIEELSKLSSLHKGNKWLVGMTNNSDIDLNLKQIQEFILESSNMLRGQKGLRTKRRPVIIK